VQKISICYFNDNIFVQDGSATQACEPDGSFKYYIICWAHLVLPEKWAGVVTSLSLSLTRMIAQYTGAYTRTHAPRSSGRKLRTMQPTEDQYCQLFRRFFG